MNLIKKLAFAPIFLIFLAFASYQISQIFFSATSLIFSLELNTLFTLLIFTMLILLSSLFFIIFVTLAQDWKLIIPTLILASLLPLIFLQQISGIVLAIGFLISFLFTFLILDQKLKTYLTFQPTTLLSGSIKNLSLFLILVISVGYFLQVNSQIIKNGFAIPDSLLDFAVNFSTPNTQVKGMKIYLAQNLTPDQIQLLKSHPELLKQSGIDPKTLDSLGVQPTQGSSTPSKDFIKNLLKDQLNNLLKPYLNFIPAVLALLLFVTLYSVLSIISIPLPLVIWLIFYLLEEVKFISFTTETREVKKLVV